MTALYFGWPAFRNRHFIIWGGTGGEAGGNPPLYSSLVGGVQWGVVRLQSGGVEQGGGGGHGGHPQCSVGNVADLDYVLRGANALVRVTEGTVFVRRWASRGIRRHRMCTRAHDVLRMPPCLSFLCVLGFGMTGNSGAQLLRGKVGCGHDCGRCLAEQQPQKQGMSGLQVRVGGGQ